MIVVGQLRALLLAGLCLSGCVLPVITRASEDGSNPEDGDVSVIHDIGYSDTIVADRPTLSDQGVLEDGVSATDAGVLTQDVVAVDRPDFDVQNRDVPTVGMDVTCGASLTLCDGLCVNLQNDSNNCNGCGRRCQFANGVGVCMNGSCALASCNQGYANCNGDLGDGCELPLNTASNCGACGRACMAPLSVCVMGVCSCPPPLTNCSGACRNLEVDVRNCGECNYVCPNRAGFPPMTCEMGACREGV